MTMRTEENPTKFRALLNIRQTESIARLRDEAAEGKRGNSP